MAYSNTQGQGSFVVLLEFLAGLSTFSILLLLTTYRRKVSDCLLRVFHLRQQPSTSQSVTEQVKPPITPTSRDLERGDVQSSAQRNAQLLDASSLARVLAYLHGLPVATQDYVTMREVSLYSQDSRTSEGNDADPSGNSSSGHGEDTVESLESNWVEIIQKFPAPPEPSPSFRCLVQTELSSPVLSDADTALSEVDSLSEPRSPAQRVPSISASRETDSGSDSDNSCSTICPSIPSASSLRAVES